jgi:4-hydroxybenzoate polyprenyltransferase
VVGSHTYAAAMVRRRVRGLLLSAHPVPTLAVTVMTTVLVAVAGNRGRVCVLAALAVLTGQLSIGWSNDLIDSDRDAASKRTDKPAAVGEVSRSLLLRATAVAGLATVPLSLSLGWRPGLVHLLGVSCGWAYNLRLKSSVLSALPYLIAFGGLPAIATLALPAHRWAPAWALAAAGLLGVAAHFANVLPDLADDLATGVRGLPHRLGSPRSALTGAVAVVLAGILVLFGPGPAPGPGEWIGAAAVLGLAVAAVLLNRRSPRSDGAFLATMAAAAVNVALIAAGHALVA